MTSRIVNDFSITVSTAPAMPWNEHTAADIASGVA